jgi:uncharacterized phage protein gp47/JayE
VTYITFPIESEPEDMIADVIAFIQSVFPAWQPHDGNIDTALIEAFCATAADVRELASQVPDSVFRYFGANIIGLDPIDATSASVNSTWTARDALGHTITGGTRVGIRNSAGELVPFEVLADAVIPAGLTATDWGAVPLVAVDAGESGSGLGGVGSAAELIDVLDWVSSVTLTEATSGGVDAELDDAYLDRLQEYLTLLAPRPILPADFALMARQIAGVSRAVAIDGYDPGTSTFDNARTVAIAALDANGTPVSSLVKQQIKTYLESLREVNFVVNAIDAVVTAIDVVYDVTALAGYDTTDLLSRIDAALADYLSPATWGSSGSDPNSWTNTTVVRYLEIAQVINSVDGVDYINSLTIGTTGSMASADYNMTGVAAVADAGTFTGTVS